MILPFPKILHCHHYLTAGSGSGVSINNTKSRLHQRLAETLSAVVLRAHLQADPRQVDLTVRLVHTCRSPARGQRCAVRSMSKHARCTPVRAAPHASSNLRTSRLLDLGGKFSLPQSGPQSQEIAQLSDTIGSGDMARLPKSLCKAYRGLFELRSSGSAELSNLSIRLAQPWEPVPMSSLLLFASKIPGKNTADPSDSFMMVLSRR